MKTEGWEPADPAPASPQGFGAGAANPFAKKPEPAPAPAPTPAGGLEDPPDDEQGDYVPDDGDIPF